MDNSTALEPLTFSSVGAMAASISHTQVRQKAMSYLYSKRQVEEVT